MTCADEGRSLSKTLRGRLRMRRLRHRVAFVVAGSLVLGSGASAGAQSLSDYLELGEERALELSEARARASEAAARRTALERTLFPSLSASATYRRNQNEEVVTLSTGPMEELEEVVLVPRNEFTARAAVEVPVIAVGAWKQRRAASELADAAELRLEEAQNDLAERIAGAYYQHVGAAAMVESAKAAVEAALVHQREVVGRLEAGLATELERRRAEAQVARSRQTLAEAKKARADAARTLRVLTGVRPSGSPPALDADPSPEAPLESWLEGAEGLPEVRAARARARARAVEARKSELYYVPEVVAFAEERYTSTVGLGQAVGWGVGVRASWRFDFAAASTAKAEQAEARAAELRADLALRDARARIEAAWERVLAMRARLEAATSEAKSTVRAGEIARADYPDRASQLDVVRAERDALTAEMERIRAAADLAYARAALRIAADRAGELEG